MRDVDMHVHVQAQVACWLLAWLCKTYGVMYVLVHILAFQRETPGGARCSRCGAQGWWWLANHGRRVLLWDTPWLSKDVDAISRVAVKHVDLKLRHLVRLGSARTSPMVDANCRQKMLGSPPRGIPQR